MVMVMMVMPMGTGHRRRQSKHGNGRGGDGKERLAHDGYPPVMTLQALNLWDLVATRAVMPLSI
jgi:hypothetical protein